MVWLGFFLFVGDRVVELMMRENSWSLLGLFLFKVSTRLFSTDEFQPLDPTQELIFPPELMVNFAAYGLFFSFVFSLVHSLELILKSCLTVIHQKKCHNILI